MYLDFIPPVPRSGKNLGLLSLKRILQSRGHWELPGRTVILKPLPASHIVPRPSLMKKEIPSLTPFPHMKGCGWKWTRQVRTGVLALKFMQWVLPWWSRAVRLHTPSAGGPGLIPGRGTRSRVPQLRVRMPQLKDPARGGEDPECCN